MIKAILFDMDGTLIDSESHYVDGTYRWMQRYGFKGEVEEIYPIIGTTMKRTCEILGAMIEKNVDEVDEINDKYFTIEDPLRYDRLIFPEVREVLLAFKEMGLTLALCTVSGQKEVERFFEDCHLEGVFDRYLTGERITHPKPDPEIYETMLHDLGYQKEEVIVVEDSSAGIEAGKRAGIYTVARRDKRFHIDQSHADEWIDDLKELLCWVKERNNG